MSASGFRYKILHHSPHLAFHIEGAAEPSELYVQANPLGQRHNQLFACLELFSAWSHYALVAATHQLSNDIAPKSFRGLAELPTSRRRRSAWMVVEVVSGLMPMAATNSLSKN